MHRVLFLYSELAGYMHSCISELSKQPWVENVMVIHWPINVEAPFTFASATNLSLVEKCDKSGRWKDEIHKFQPTAIVCSGWVDQDYLKCTRQWVHQIPVIVTIDNWWTGSARQRMATWLSTFVIKRHFNKAWVPGLRQLAFAQRLGFQDLNIQTGLYCANSAEFESIWAKRQSAKRQKKLLYVGRYIDVKGIRELWSAFKKIAVDHPDWSLHCIGTGQLWDSKAIHPQIIHHGFVQPGDLGPHLENAAAFVMPSIHEPWGVVLHEMAISGLPLLVSNQVASAELFLKESVNGFTFATDEIEPALRKFIKLSPKERKLCDIQSHHIGMSHNLSQWIETAKKLIDC